MILIHVLRTFLQTYWRKFWLSCDTYNKQKRSDLHTLPDWRKSSNNIALFKSISCSGRKPYFSPVRWSRIKV